MRQLIFFLNLLFFIPNLLGQTYYLNESIENEMKWDSIIVYSFDSFTQDWTYSFKNIFSYNEDDTRKDWVTYNWSEFDEEWIKGMCWPHVYDGKENLIQFYTAEWDNILNTWDTIYKVDFSYDSVSNQKVQLRYVWVEDSSRFLPLNCFTRNYSENNLETFWIFEKTNDYGLTWNKGSKKEWYYNENHTVAYNLYYNWNDLTNQWDSAYKYNFQQDTYENSFQDTVYKYENGWIYNQLSDFSYDEIQNTISDILYTWSISKQDWEISSKKIFYYSEKPILRTKEIIANSIKTYPNPTKGIINIELSSNFNPLIEIFDINGRIVSSERVINNNTIDISHFNNGIYFIRYLMGETVISKKIIKY